uniref:Uncharacterized protein n=1 Tax=Amphimedon queenslandica TaxID=400682 RepID=A0A1X7TTP0_AMPQE
ERDRGSGDRGRPEGAVREMWQGWQHFVARGKEEEGEGKEGEGEAGEEGDGGRDSK